jgi:diguanylate cyclase (GGDEF)-like protein
MLATRILARRLQRDVIDPLGHVAEVAHAVRRDRAFERRVPSAGIAEIDRFGQDFNALLAELQGWHDGLTSENAELARRAAHDPLTGLGNRRLFEQRLSLAIGDCAPGGEAFAVLFFDIDNFKQINDRHGHESGDAALIAVGERLRGAIRQHDQAFRLGGDEFAALLVPLECRAQVDQAVSQITQALALPIRLPSAALASLQVSIGVATFPDDGMEPQDLLRRADEAMYRQKKRSQPIAGSGDNSGQDR